MQECPQTPPGPTSHAGRARTGAPTDRSRSLAIGRAVRGGRPDQCVEHCPCLPVFFSWLHFRQPRRQQPHVAAHSSDHRIGSGLRTPRSPPVRRSQTSAAATLRAVEQCRSSMARSPGHQLADPDHQQWPPHNAQICAAGAERGIDAATAPNGGSARGYLTLSTLATVLQSRDYHPHHQRTMPFQHGCLFLRWERWPVRRRCAGEGPARPGESIERCWVFVVSGGAQETADTQQRSPAHASGAAAPALKLATRAWSRTVGRHRQVASLWIHLAPGERHQVCAGVSAF